MGLIASLDIGSEKMVIYFPLKINAQGNVISREFRIFYFCQFCVYDHSNCRAECIVCLLYTSDVYKRQALWRSRLRETDNLCQSTLPSQSVSCTQGL